MHVRKQNLLFLVREYSHAGYLTSALFKTVFSLPNILIAVPFSY